MRLREGANWMRILPPLEGSSGWMKGVLAHSTSRGKWTHPRTFDPTARSVWDDVRDHLHKTDPSRLASRKNPNGGLNLRPAPVSLMWVLVRESEAEDSPYVCRLLVQSGYSGEWGGHPGLGHQILELSRERDEAGELQHPIAGTEDGVQVCIQMTTGKESRFSRYGLRAGTTPAPISGCLDRLAPGEAEALCPLEEVLRPMSAEEQWERLARLMPAAEVTAIRRAISHP
ncbi:MAG: hypothetical protein KDN05_20510 [Verrucomicrobiae bacterium]|nr:hypothetical protein [Verrucomicrobiae bacterium]